MWVYWKPNSQLNHGVVTAVLSFPHFSTRKLLLVTGDGYSGLYKSGVSNLIFEISKKTIVSFSSFNALKKEASSPVVVFIQLFLFQVYSRCNLFSRHPRTKTKGFSSSWRLFIECAWYTLRATLLKRKQVNNQSTGIGFRTNGAVIYIM